VNNPFDIKESDVHAFGFALHMSHHFFVSVSLDFPYAVHALFPERLSNHGQGLRCTLSEICTKCDAVPLSDPSRNRIRTPGLQIKGRKKSACPPSCVKFCTLTPEMC
jgi:hypothetical protein